MKIVQTLINLSTLYIGVALIVNGTTGIQSIAKSTNTPTVAVSVKKHTAPLTPLTPLVCKPETLYLPIVKVENHYKKVLVPIPQNIDSELVYSAFLQSLRLRYHSEIQVKKGVQDSIKFNSK